MQLYSFTTVVELCHPLQCQSHCKGLGFGEDCLQVTGKRNIPRCSDVSSSADTETVPLNRFSRNHPATHVRGVCAHAHGYMASMYVAQGEFVTALKALELAILSTLADHMRGNL